MRWNVLQLIGSFAQGGSERQAVQLTRLLRQDGRFHVRVACFDPTGPLRVEIDRLDIAPLASFPLTSFFDGNALRQWGRFRSFLRQNRIHILQTHDFYTNVFGMFGGLLARTPVRIASRRETAGVRTAAQTSIELRALRAAHAVVANAEAVRRYAVAQGVDAAKVTVVYNGIDTARLAPGPDFSRAAALRRFGLPDGRPLVAIVANMRHPVKDHPTFLRAAALVHRECPEAGFVLAGEGELLENLRGLAAELGFAAHVWFTGRCDDVAELLAVADICVLSSRAEGFSNSVLEYMAAGKPVVATDVGGAREAIREGETGYVVAPGDSAAMAGRILLLLRDPVSARRMGEAGALRVEKDFSCAAQLQRTCDLYASLLSARLRTARSSAAGMPYYF
jgi:glycosyltransferase involved in cell wall biosynthesis